MGYPSPLAIAALVLGAPLAVLMLMVLILAVA
jgi:hypothetical protein